MNLRITLLAALLLPSLAMAQAYDPRTGQRYDQFGRPLPSLAELCRQGQMAGGPITLQCGQYDLRFNRKGERLVRYRFEKWGYNVLDNGVTEREARRLDSDPAFRAKYIKQHGYDKYKVNESKGSTDVANADLPPDLLTPSGKRFLDHGMAASYKDGRGLIMLSDLPCKGHPGYIARLSPDDGDVVYGCSDSFIADKEFTITWNDGAHGVYEPDEFVPTDLGVKYRAKVSASK
ncbi:hypothetical protein WM28_13775 [Burkholderia ubonensis]|uniref:hypothetical protein n=1 Tax=Burkholderia ubonensis TaxID=101571 RepID=UPI00075FA64C|nr:hypothetical protein [Burkholderia ubonensis]KWO50916.1 hypothetical protein WM28_13775 [Burkholderia ubonensis]